MSGELHDGPYQPERYWSRLHDDGGDESTVGYPGLARSFNAGMYRSLERAVARSVDAAGLRIEGADVLDVGSGTGIWIDFWERCGAARIAGVDLAGSSVARLQGRWPERRFLQLDIGDCAADTLGEHDIVSAMSVLLHIVDDARFARAVATLGAAVRPGGALVTIDPAVVYRWWGPPFGPQSNSRARPLADYRVALDRAGLRLEHVRPATVLLSNVVDTRRESSFRALSGYWSLLTRAVGSREPVGRAAVAVLGRCDATATRLLRTGPSAKVLIARRRP